MPHSAIDLLKCGLRSTTLDLQSPLCSRLRQMYPECLWLGCSQSFREFTLEDISSHIRAHAKKKLFCRWKSCPKRCDTTVELYQHLQGSHDLPATKDIPQARYCFNCSQCIQSMGEWETHCAEHLAKLDMYCGRITRRGVILSALLCPFCLGDARLSPGQRYTQFTEHRRFVQHVNDHLRLHQRKRISCPHPLCEPNKFVILQLWDHLRQEHGTLAPKDQHHGVEVESSDDAAFHEDDDSEAKDDLETCDGGKIADSSDASVEYEVGDDFTPGIDVPSKCAASPVQQEIGNELIEQSANQSDSRYGLTLLGEGSHDRTTVGLAMNLAHFDDGLSFDDWMRDDEPYVAGVDDPQNRTETSTTELPQEPSCVSANAEVGQPVLEAVSNFPLRCRVCGKNCSTTAALAGHSKVHVGRHCPDQNCNETFATRKQAISHMIRVHGTSPWMCDLQSLENPESACGKPFRGNSELKEHKRMHEKKESLKCKEPGCNRQFHRASALQTHVDVAHRGRNPHHCQYRKGPFRCQSAFTESWKLKRHIQQCHSAPKHSTE